MTSAAEIWKDIPGYEGRYQASNLGRICSVDRRVPCCHGATRTVKGRILRPACQKRDPHLSVVLGHGAAGSAVHRLVASAFLGPCPEGQEVRHLDGDPQNNRVENLAYGTRTENILDVMRTGQSWRGSVTVPQVHEIRERLKNGQRAVDIAKDMGVSPASVYGIKQGRKFKWLK